MKKIVLIYGIIAGVVVSTVMAIGMYMCSTNPDYKPSMVAGYATQVIAFSLIFVGIKVYRDKYNAGAIKFGKAFLIGLYISLITSTMYVSTWAIEYNYVLPDDFMAKYMAKYKAQMIKEAKERKTPDAVINKELIEMGEMQADYSKPVYFILYTYVEILPTGLLISLISALILKKKPKEEPWELTVADK